MAILCALFGDGENVTPSKVVLLGESPHTMGSFSRFRPPRLPLARCVENHCHEVRDFSYSFAEAYRKAEQTPGVATQGKPNAGCFPVVGTIWNQQLAPRKLMVKKNEVSFWRGLFSRGYICFKRE